MDQLLRRILQRNMNTLDHIQPMDDQKLDTSEQIYFSSLPLLKMLRHGRAGVPMEVTGILLGEFIDDYTITVTDCFPIPQKGTSVNVESFDEIYQRQMIDMLHRTGRRENMVGWYHSHPGFGCWLSGVDIQTAMTVEGMDKRCVAVVVDPIQSVKGKVVIDGFRTVGDIVLGGEIRHTTSNLGHLRKPSIQALLHGLNRLYYSIDINFRTNELERDMLENLHKQPWTAKLGVGSFKKRCEDNLKSMEEMSHFAKEYHKAMEEEEKYSKKELALRNVGKKDPKRHLENLIDQMLSDNVLCGISSPLKIVTFK